MWTQLLQLSAFHTFQNYLWGLQQFHFTFLYQTSVFCSGELFCWWCLLSSAKKKHSVLIICMFWHPTVRSSSATSWLVSRLPLSYVFQFFNITELLRTTGFFSEGLKHTKAVGNLKLWRNLSGQFYNNHHTTSSLRPPSGYIEKVSSEIFKLLCVSHNLLLFKEAFDSRSYFFSPIFDV
jgi:hypothetical protein